MGEAREVGSWLVTRSAFPSSDFIRGGSRLDTGDKGFTVPDQSGPLREESEFSHLFNKYLLYAKCCLKHTRYSPKH